ncbi:MAG TPA: hypothetical protein VJ386_00800 [Candidatus Deferrimicrobiaceae bacterium]|jgi:hypothetical protein|nr:hypothetical protein [Candidatus Deferrimicrobiaceae bacterium]
MNTPYTRAMLHAALTSPWANLGACDGQARKPAAMFEGNFAQFADQVSQEVRSAGVRK